MHSHHMGESRHFWHILLQKDPGQILSVSQNHGNRGFGGKSRAGLRMETLCAGLLASTPPLEASADAQRTKGGLGLSPRRPASTVGPGVAPCAAALPPDTGLTAREPPPNPAVFLPGL